MFDSKDKLEELWLECKTACENEVAEIESSVMNRLVTDMSFEDMLHNDSNVFDNYRYFFEPKHLDEIRNNPLRSQFLRVLAFELYGFLQRSLGE